MVSRAPFPVIHAEGAGTKRINRLSSEFFSARGIRLAPSATVLGFLQGFTMPAEVMPGKSKLSVNAAVMTCLARCTGSAAPLACLGEFLDELAGLGWTSSDIRQVATAVLTLLRRSGVTANSTDAVGAAA